MKVGSLSLALHRPIPPAVLRGRFLFLSLYSALLAGGLLLGQEVVDFAYVFFQSANEAYLYRLIIMVGIVYMLVMAIPFVPAAEIGLSRMLFVGPEVAVFVYLSTVLALMTGYLVGRAVPPNVCAAAFAYFGFLKAHDLVLEMAARDTHARLEMLVARAPRQFVPGLLRHRYLALALAINLPGNTLIGGGGGIALTAGMSGLYPMPAFLATVALAVAPVPLLVGLSPLWL